MANGITSMLGYLTSFVQGDRLIDGGQLRRFADFSLKYTTGIVALSSGGQPGATPLSYGMNRVDTVAADGDSVMLPPALPGATVVVYNNSAHTLNVVGQAPNTGGLAAGDTIAPIASNTQAATGTGVNQATAVMTQYVCFVLGQWKQGALT